MLECASDNYSSIDDACAQKGVDSFKKDYVQIIDTIKKLNSAATVKVINLYNPYRDDSEDVQEKALFDQADGYISQINAELNFVNDTYTYVTVDVYKAFAGKFEDGTFKVSTYTHFSEESRDPHPTDTGHEFIAQLHQ